MIIHPDFLDFISALNGHRVDYVIVGAFDLAFLGRPRYTGDLDIWIRPTAANARALLRAIDDFGLKSLSLTERDILSGEVIQFGYPPVRIDLLTVLDGLTSKEIWSSRRKGPLGDKTVWYLDKAAFIKNKRAAGRPRDRADVAELNKPLKPEA
ncbi:MAG: hypothetical protein HY552_00530 [Elusimicrobia bacterium]|nr:hypothetical protein [Elusimicrobiota bacterium]